LLSCCAASAAASALGLAFAPPLPRGGLAFLLGTSSAFTAAASGAAASGAASAAFAA